MSGGLNWDRARDAERLSRSPSAGLQWWIVLARRGSRCAHCGNETYATPIAFCHEVPEYAYCQSCWERAGIAPKPSKGYLKSLQSQAGAKGRTKRRRRRRSKSQS